MKKEYKPITFDKGTSIRKDELLSIVDLKNLTISENFLGYISRKKDSIIRISIIEGRIWYAGGTYYNDIEGNFDQVYLNRAPINKTTTYEIY